MKTALIIIVFQFILVNSSIAQSEPVPFSRLFHNFGDHFMSSFTYNYGMNHLAGIGLTYGMVESGMDWQIRKFSSKNRAVQYAGFPSVIIGGLVPLILPASLYYYAGNRQDYKLQNTALALGQAAILGWTISFLSTRLEQVADLQVIFRKMNPKKTIAMTLILAFLDAVFLMAGQADIP